VCFAIPVDASYLLTELLNTREVKLFMGIQRPKPAKWRELS
jgi:hypothetical protein